jgi:hypothetical protein
MIQRSISAENSATSSVQTSGHGVNGDEQKDHGTVADPFRPA